MTPAEALAGIKLIAESAKALGNILPSSGKLRSELSKVHSSLVQAQQVALDLQTALATANQRVFELEEQIKKGLDWTTELERYELTEITAGVVVYRLKASAQKSDEAPHSLCVQCAQDGKKAFLQRKTIGTKGFLDCPRCNAAIADGTFVNWI